LGKACPVLTPVERQVVDAISSAENALIATVYKAMEEATLQACAEMQAAGSSERPPSLAYFTSVVHHRMFCLMCGADPETMEGGDPDMASRILENGRKISEHYWQGVDL